MLTSDGFNGTCRYANPERSKERLRQCKVVILRLQHKKAGLIKEITVQNGKTGLIAVLLIWEIALIRFCMMIKETSG